MPRADKRYESNSARQAAYRERRAALKPPRDAAVASLARSLHRVIADTAANPAMPRHTLAQEMLGSRYDETLRKLIDYFDDDGFVPRIIEL